jgi:hypothetical protein
MYGAHARRHFVGPLSASMLDRGAGHGTSIAALVRAGRGGAAATNMAAGGETP